MAEHAHTPTTRIARRRRPAAPDQATNVVTLPKRLTGTEAIVAEVRGRSNQEDKALIRRMEATLAALESRHRDRARSLLPIGLRMDAPMLTDFIEIGQRMLAGRAGS